MELLGVLVLLLLAGGKRTQTQEPNPTPTPDASGGGKVRTPTEAIVGAVSTVAGLVLKLAAGAGGGAGATAATVAGTAAGASLAGTTLVFLVANPVAWAIYVLIGTIISKHQSEAKNFDLAVFRLGAHARGLHEYERQMLSAYQEENAVPGVVSKSEVRDGRMDYVFNAGGYGRVTFQGWRTVARLIPAPAPKYGTPHPLAVNDGWHKLAKVIRAASLVYLDQRAKFGAAILQSRLGKREIPEGYLLDGFALTKQYEANEPGLGGLLSFPLIDGKVVAGFREEPENPYPPKEQLIGADTAPDTDALQASDVYAARIAALLEAVCVFKFDLQIWTGTPEEWAREVYKWIGQPSGVTVSGRKFICDRAVWGGAYEIDCWEAKTTGSTTLPGKIVAGVK